MDTEFKEYLLNVTKAEDCKEVEVIQSLWSNYGKIFRCKLFGAATKTVVVKSILLKQDSQRNSDFSHNRKVKSYAIETNWYKNWNHRCSTNCKTPACIGTFSKGNQQWIILEDLVHEFPKRISQISINEVKVCLKWLANFHATFLSSSPTDLWQMGTYWHLATRPEEYKKMPASKLKSKAFQIDQILNECRYQTIVHGDAKLANFCFSNDGTQVAAVDFQYVGGGCGMKDVAYFLGSCLTSSECNKYESELLDFYFYELKQSVVRQAISIDFILLENEWRRLYLFSCADFMRFLLGWMPGHTKINPYNLAIVESVLSSI